MVCLDVGRVHEYLRAAVRCVVCVAPDTKAHEAVGYDTGVISGALVTIGSDLGPAALSSGQDVCVFRAATEKAYNGNLKGTDHFRHHVGRPDRRARRRRTVRLRGTEARPGHCRHHLHWRSSWSGRLSYSLGDGVYLFYRYFSPPSFAMSPFRVRVS